MKILTCLLLTVAISGVFMAPPRQVVEMNEMQEKSESLNEIKGTELKEEDLKPVDHLDAVKLEQDGMINKDYKKEIFLGNHEEIDDDSLDVAENKLRDIFDKYVHISTCVLVKNFTS